MRPSSPAVWLAAYAAVVLVPLAALLVGERPPGLGAWWDASMAAGFAGLSLMAVQFLLTARFKRAAAPFGIDIIYYFHRHLAYVLVVVLLAHPAILLVENPALVEFLDPRTAPASMRWGLVALLAAAVLMVTSVIRKRLRLEYDVWRPLHLVLSIAAVGGGIAHIRGVGYYASMPAVDGVWTAIAVSLAGLVVYVRVWRPWRLRQQPYRVASVTVERGDAWTLELAPVGHRGLTFLPGQFVWLTLGTSPFAMREHPFSVSSEPRTDGSLAVTVKALGNFTNRIGATRIGATAYVDGPYGAFSIDHHPADGYVFLAGGIGIAPIMSFIRTLADRRDPRPLLLVYAYRRLDRMTFRDAIEALRETLRLDVVYVLEEPPNDWTGEVGRISVPLLERHLPPAAERRRCEYFVCGPTAMIDSTEQALVSCGVPVGRIRSEIFDLA
jgi:predicted ferric reductase